MQQFKIRQDGFKEIRKNTLLRSIPIFVILIIFIVVTGTINSRNKAEDINTLPFIIPIILGAASFGIYRGIKKQAALFASYTLSISNNLIRREQLNTPAISIYYNDVKEILKNKNGSFTIKGKVTSDLIGIPAQIDNYAQLEATLQNIKTITIKEKEPLLQKFPGILGIIMLGLMLCVYTVNNKIIVAVSGTIVTGLMLWSLLKIQHSKNVDHKTKRNSWLVLIVLISVIAITIFKLTGQINALKH